MDSMVVPRAPGSHETRPAVAGMSTAVALVAILCVSYPILMSVVARAAEGATVGGYSPLLRIGLWACCVTVGLCVPNFMQLVTLMSSVVVVAVAVFVPIGVYWALFWRAPRPGSVWWTAAKHAAVALVLAEALRHPKGFWAYSG